MRTWDLPVLERVGRSPDARDESGLHAFATLPFTVFARATSILSRLALPLALLGYLAVSLSATETLAQVAVPFTQNNLSLNSLSSEVTYTVDLSTLPERPMMTATVVPDASHGDISLQVEISGCNLVNPSGSCPLTRLSSPGVGPRSVSYEPHRCIVGTTYPAYVGKTCNVKLRALDFGSAGAPAQVDLSIRAVTVVPTSTISSSITSNPVQTVSIAPSKDTTIYEANTTSSNGAGDSFWVRAASGIAIPDQLRSLIAFDVGAAIPAGVTILDARIELTVLSHVGNSTVILSAVPRNPISWTEGAGNASGDESTPPGSVVGGASWSHRNWASIFSQGPWTGGAFQVPALDASTARATGTFVLASPELVAHVITLASTSALHDGLILHTTTGTARFASDENPNVSQRPRLIVDFTIPPTLSGSGINIPTSTSSFINENQRFRWLYDLDHDDVLITSVLGRCEVTNTVGFLLPYTYQFQGSPTFAGVDCCTWQLDSATGISGTGQALFFVNVDASHPANQPADSDLDGIKNLCDNCPSIPNGPFLGSCFSGSRAGSLCRSNQECSGGFCSFAQDDDDLDGVGNACVPEPGVGSGLASGLIGMAWLCRRSRIFPRRVACPARDSTE